MKKQYRYALGLTSQLPFCATPIRLDPYNKCQFGCGYCFASTRKGFGRGGGLQVVDSNLIEDRLSRVESGVVRSALDEFLERRIPLQLGGMSDPFSKIEFTEKKTLHLIQILKRYSYPFIISTKSTLVATDMYLAALDGANAYVRFSTTVVSESLKARIDVGCPSISEVANAAKRLSIAGIPVSFRFQPIIPSFELEAFRLIDLASEIGVKHISAEYLKVPLEANLRFGRGLREIMNCEPIAFYRQLGALKSGSEYVLPLAYRSKFLIEMYKYAKSNGLSFGFADNDLLLHSDGASCCSASDLYLSNSNNFEANIVVLAKKKKHSEEIYFSELLNAWIPENSVGTYLNSKSRIQIKVSGQPDWPSYLKRFWQGEDRLYSPDYFDGVKKTGKRDANGLFIYKRVQSEFGLALIEKVMQ